MKSKSTLSYFKGVSIFTGLALLLGLVQSCTVSENAFNGEVKKGKTHYGARDVKIYPDMIKKVMHIKNMEKDQLDFFVFDNSGTLMVHYKMDENDHKKIDGLDRGTYTYQVFKKDEMSESGKIIIK